MSELLVLIVIGLGTYAMRAIFLITAGEGPPGMLSHFLPHVGPAVLAAITVPALLAPQGAMSLAHTLPALAAAAGTWGLWARTHQLPVALLGGLALWWALVAIVPS